MKKQSIFCLSLIIFFHNFIYSDENFVSLKTRTFNIINNTLNVETNSPFPLNVRVGVHDKDNQSKKLFPIRKSSTKENTMTIEGDKFTEEITIHVLGFLKKIFQNKEGDINFNNDDTEFVFEIENKEALSDLSIKLYSKRDSEDKHLISSVNVPFVKQNVEKRPEFVQEDVVKVPEFVQQDVVKVPEFVQQDVFNDRRIARKNKKEPLLKESENKKKPLLKKIENKKEQNHKDGNQNHKKNQK